MHLTAIQIQGFGPLSDFLLEGLTPGLNVVYGPNGSGKSTLLQFVRGVLLGFDEARQLGLLPPREWTPTVRRHAGGSIAFVDGDRRVGIVRTSGADQRDHLGVRIQDGDDADAQQYRARLQRLSPEVVKLLLAVGTSEAHSIEAMLELAARSGWPLQPTVTESPEHQARLEEIRKQQAQLLGEDAEAAAGVEQTLKRLDQRRREMAESLESARQSVLARYRTLLDREQQSLTSLAALTAELEHAHQLLQSCQCDLHAAEDVLWNARTECELPVAAHPPVVSVTGIVETTSDDGQIARARQMLLDLAQARYGISCEIADRLLQVDVSDASQLDAGSLRADRDQIDRCEHEIALYLSGLLSRRRHQTSELHYRAPTVQTADVLPIANEDQQERVAALQEAVDVLHVQVAACWQAHQSVSAQWAAAAESLRRLRGERQALSADDGLDALRFQLQVLDQEWRRIHEDWQALKLAEVALTRATTLHRVETPAELIAQASSLFQNLTQGRYRELRYLPEAGSLAAVNALAESTNLSLLSRGTLDQAALSLRLAMLQRCSSEGIHWPVVLDEALVDSDLDRLRLAASLLHEFAHESRQVIYLTCLEHLVDVLQSAGANILVMPGHRRMMRVDAPQAIQRPHWLKSREVAPAGTPSEQVAQVPVERAVKRPNEGFWLRADSPLSLVPSIGMPSASKLASIGIRNVGDLLSFSVNGSGVDWDQLQVASAQLSIWQAEAGLLCSVPRLTGRDAQFLVAAGILNAQQLAGESPDVLMRRVDRLRGASLDHGAVADWPRHSDLVAWITAARDCVPAAPIEAEAAEPNELQFYLELTSPIVDAPSIGPTTARKLSRIGIHTVSEFLNRDSVIIAQRLGDRRITAETIREWQQQAELMTRIPGLRGHDAQVLVACGIVDPSALASAQPEMLFAKVGPFVATNEGRRLLRSAKVPDLHEVSDWIDWARQACALRAA